MPAKIAQLKKFKSSEDGGFIIFGLFLFVTMLLITGFGVDMVRFENDRKRAQNALDNAVLSATNLQQSLDSEEVIYSFMETAGYSRDEVTVDVDETTASNGGEVLSRSIVAGVNTRTPTFFMDELGVDSLNAAVGSGATEAVQNVEISLVLDISGSMRFGPASYNSIAGLRDAVDEFINIVLDVECDASGLNCVQSPDSASTTINVVPYAGNVNPGRELFNIMGGRRWHNWSHCMEITDQDFTNADLPSDELNQLPHFMAWAIDTPTMNWGWCPKDTSGILVAENNAAKIKNYIRNIRLHDGTATHVGMKYGVALLNPSSRDEFQALNALETPLVADEYRFRPANFEDDVQKYIVVMTDGGTTSSRRPRSTSDANHFDYNDVYSLLPEEWNAFLNGDPRQPPAAPTAEWTSIMNRYGSFDATAAVNPSESVEYGYPGASDYVDPDGVRHTAAVNNANLIESCDLAKQSVTLSDGSTKADRITVYSIAFNAGSAASALMGNCATLPAGSTTPGIPYFWEINDRSNPGAMRSAFRSIAYSINKLKLTQ